MAEMLANAAPSVVRINEATTLSCESGYMRQDHRNFRKKERLRREWRRLHPSPPPKKAFGGQVVAFTALAAIVGWNAAPRVTAALGTMSRSPDEIAAIEHSAFYPNCDAARAADVAPIYAGMPGYREMLDGDSDGIACEPYRGR